MKQWAGPGLVAVGAVVFVVGIVGTLAGGSSDSAAEPADSTSTTSALTTSTVAAATTEAPAPTTTVVSPPSSTTSTAAPTTTAPPTTVPVPETVEQFVAAYAAALETGDRNFVFERLHPVVVDGFGAELCSSWVDAEIMALSDYTLVSVNSGPITQSVITPAGSQQVENFFDASVSFTFQGQSFDAGGAFALVGLEMHWLGQCR
jgi:hypothetical protein